MNRQESRENYQKRYRTIKQNALSAVCIKCERCRSKNNLQLHLKYYARDSIRPKVHCEAGNITLKRWKEAIGHPERFQVLCLSCHNTVGKKGKHTKIINISTLFENSTNLEVRVR